jgi:hypothetical protein
MDCCTYIHHTLPYILIHVLWYDEWKHREISCSYEYSNTTLLYSYAWLYTWFLCIYLPWRYYTGDTVYSILDQKQISKPVMLGFIGFIHILIFISNMFGYLFCSVMLEE